MGYSVIIEICKYRVASVSTAGSSSEAKKLMLRCLVILRCAITNARSTWTARHYPRFDSIAPTLRNRYYLGVLDQDTATPPHADAETVTVPTTAPPLPQGYDWRTDSGALAQCIGTIQDQGKCGSCWAVASIESLSDRRCIRSAQSNGTTGIERIALSSLDIIACDKLCEGIEKCCRGCTGGYPKLAFEYVKEKGVVSATCMPYDVNKSLLCPLPPCEKPLDDEKYKAKQVKQIFGGALAMQAEILQHGPVAATFTVYEDFFNYASGVYQLTNMSGKRAGLHAVKVLGWGVLNDINSETRAGGSGSVGLPYWRAQNSWGAEWGMNGSFLIAQGQCGFEESVFTATPCLDGEICV